MYLCINCLLVLFLTASGIVLHNLEFVTRFECIQLTTADKHRLSHEGINKNSFLEGPRENLVKLFL